MSLSPYLKREFDLLGFHNLEIYLHLTDGYVGKRLKFWWNARRDLVSRPKTHSKGVTVILHLKPEVLKCNLTQTINL